MADWQQLIQNQIYFDDTFGVPGTTWPIGTAAVPSDVIADVITMCAARKIRTIHVHGALTLAATMEHYCFHGPEHEDIADIVSLGGQNVGGSHIDGLIVTGAQGTGFLSLVRCIISAVTLFKGQMNRCSFYAGTSSFKDLSYIDLIDCESIYGVVTITVQAPARASIKNWRGNLILTAQDGGVCYVRGYKGSLEIDAMTDGTLSVYANGADITINADCTAGTINIYGSAVITDNSVIGCTVNDYTEQDDRADKTAELIAADMALVTAFSSGLLADTAEATLCALDAIGGTKKDVKVTVYIAGVTAGNIQERWYLTSLAAPDTFVIKHPENAAHNPGAAAVLTREFGDVPEGLQLEFRIDCAGDDDQRAYEVELSYLS